MEKKLKNKFDIFGRLIRGPIQHISGNNKINDFLLGDTLVDSDGDLFNVLIIDRGYVQQDSKRIDPKGSCFYIQHNTLMEDRRESIYLTFEEIEHIYNYAKGLK